MSDLDLAATEAGLASGSSPTTPLPSHLAVSPPPSSDAGENGPDGAGDRLGTEASWREAVRQRAEGVRQRMLHLVGTALLVVIVGLGSTPLARGSIASGTAHYRPWEEALPGIVALISLSFLPAWLFVRFLRARAGSLWNEYVLNLHRLGMDHLNHLPEPPPNSIYHRRWVEAGGRAVGDRPTGAHDRAKTIYEEKFEAYYGKGTASWEPRRPGHFSIETFFPVLLCTAVFAVGWVIVLGRPETFRPGRVAADDILAFAFMGSYVFALQMLVRRYFQADLRASAYLSAVVRVLTALVVALVVYRSGLADLLRPGEWSGDQDLAIAFGIGFLPIAGLQALQKVLSAGLRTVTRLPSLTSDYPLGDLDGLNVWYEARLLEEGIEDMQNLATANLVDVMLHTRVPVGRLVDWVDQAHLYLHLERPERDGRGTWKGGDRGKLRCLGIRTATDLEDAMLGHQAAGGADQSLPAADDPVAKAVSEACQHDGASVPATVLRTLAREPNLRHVRSWRADWADKPAANGPGTNGAGAATGRAGTEAGVPSLRLET